MTKQLNDSQIKYSIGVIFILFLLIRVLGAFLLENNWSFTHLFYIPIWYYSIPVIICTSLFIFNQKENNLGSNLFENRLHTYLFFGVLFSLFIIFQFDSILYGGGNYRVKQIAQVDKIIYRFYEFGSSFLVSLFFKFFSLFDLKQTTAGVFGWKLFSYIGMGLTFIASLLISKTISENPKNRFLLFLIIFFGPQTLSYFGFVGIATFVSASLYFFIYFGLQFENNKSFKSLVVLWGITFFAVFMHISLLILIPALLFITYNKLFKKNNIAFILGIKTYLLLTVLIFWVTSTNFEFSKYILFFEKANMRVDYNLFSIIHIIDFVQLLLLFVPQILIVKFLLFKDIKNSLKTFRFQLLIILILSATTFLFISEPTHSMLLDAPLFAAYLSPIAVLFALLLAKHNNSLKYAVVFSLFIPLLVFPSYIKIDLAEKQIETHIENNHHFYIEGATALQDSYLYMEELDKANHWYLILPKESRDFLDLTVAGEFNYATMYSDAIRLYLKLKTKSPFWGEPRFHLASIMMKQNQFTRARAEIDTILLISPYDKEYLKLDYAYYRDIGDFNIGKSKVLKAISLFPNDFDIQTDLAIMYYRVKDIVKADSVAIEVIQKDKSQAYAYLIRGFIAEIKKQRTQAIIFFKEYIRLAPEEPETPDIRKRLNNLILEERAN